MSADLSASFERLRTAAKELNELCDAGAATIQRLEKFLESECSLGISAYVEVDKDNDPDGPGWFKSLAYERYRGSFRVVVVEGYAIDPEMGSSKSWSECNRETKLQTLPFLPKLVEKIAQYTEEHLQVAKQAIDSVQSFVPPILPSKKTGGAK